MKCPDPERLVKDIRGLAAKIASSQAHASRPRMDGSDYYRSVFEAKELAYLFQQLDAWMSGGGSRPDIWIPVRTERDQET